MTVRRKTFAIIVIVCLGLMAVLYSSARSVILGDARKDEQLSGNKNMWRILDILVERVSSLDRFYLDRSSLNATYDFVEHPTPQLDLALFGERNQTNPASQRSSFLILVDHSGHI